MMTNQTVRWGIVGTARIATKVLAAINATSNAEVVAVASRTPERADFWARQHQVPKSYGSYEALVEDPEIDAVYIPLPPSLHAEWTIRSAQAGKHVLCEKPLAMNAAEGRAMVGACRTHNVQLMDATMWVHHPRAADMRQPLLDGSLGELRRVTSAFSFVLEPYLQQNPPHMAQDGQSGAVDLDRLLSSELRFQPQLGGGALFDLGWYNVRVALWAFGTLPQRVFATARYRHGVDVNLSAVMWYDNHRMSTFDCGYDMSRRKWFEVTGTSGSLVCDDFLSPWDPQRARFWLHDEFGRAQEQLSATPIQEQCMVENFCQIVRSNQLDDTWPRVSVDNQLVCDALAQSARRGQIIELESLITDH